MLRNPCLPLLSPSAQRKRITREAGDLPRRSQPYHPCPRSCFPSCRSSVAAASGTLPLRAYYLRCGMSNCPSLRAVKSNPHQRPAPARLPLRPANSVSRTTSASLVLGPELAAHRVAICQAAARSCKTTHHAVRQSCSQKQSSSRVFASGKVHEKTRSKCDATTPRRVDTGVSLIVLMLRQFVA